MHRFIKILAFTLLGPLLCVIAVDAPSQQFPSKRITWIVPYTPGAGSDTVARALSPKLTQALGQAVVVENRGGAGGAIGTTAGARAAPDGYTWTFGSDPPFTINPNFKKLPFDPIKDFVPVSFIARVPLVLVVKPSLAANNLREFIALAKASPGSLNASSSGNGASNHLALELLKATAGVDIRHVPYKGQAEALADVIAGRIDMTFSSVGTVHSHLKAGKLRAIGIGSLERFEGLPDVPTVAEQGYPGFEVSAWHGLLMPAGTPVEVISRVNEEISKALNAPDIASRMRALGYIPVGGPPKELERLIKSDSDKWGKVIRDAHIQGD